MFEIFKIEKQDLPAAVIDHVEVEGLGVGGGAFVRHITTYVIPGTLNWVFLQMNRYIEMKKKKCKDSERTKSLTLDAINEAGHVCAVPMSLRVRAFQGIL